MLECAAGTLYTGWTLDLRKRVAAHNAKRGAKYTRARTPVRDVYKRQTFLKGEGAFTHQHKEIIFVVVNLTQIGKIKRIADGIDPLAFMIVQDANEVMGRGFTLPGTKIEAMLKAREEKRAAEQ